MKDINYIDVFNKDMIDSTSNNYDIFINNKIDKIYTIKLEDLPYSNDYFDSISDNINVFKKVKSKIVDIKNADVKTFILKFINTFDKQLMNIVNITQISNYLPPIHMTQDDDGTIFLEWIFNDFRIGFIIEININDSGWFWITNKNLKERSCNDILNYNNLDMTINGILNYVLENT